MKVRLLAALLAAGVAASIAAGSAGAAADSNCPGGTLAGGIYNNVVVNSTCTATGEIWIKGNLTVNGNGAFLATFGGIINGNVQSWPGSVLILEGFSMTHGVSASNAQSVFLEGNLIGQGVLIQGGGGVPAGACSRHDVPITHSPIAVVLGNEVVGSVSIGGRGGCENWIVENEIAGSVNFVNNQADPTEGNAVALNLITSNLFCKNNNPHPAGNGSNSVGGTINFPGDCATP